MVAAGILDDTDRVVLIDGVLVEMSPTGPRHSGVVAWLLRHVASAAGDALRVRVQDTLLTPGGGFFEPDLFVIEPISRDRLPDRALLVVEVAFNSRRHDLWKAAAYAAAGVPEYWVVDVDRDEVLVHRDPSDDAYAGIQRMVAGDAISPLIDVPPVDVAALFAPCAAPAQACYSEGCGGVVTGVRRMSRRRRPRPARAPGARDSARLHPRARARAARAASETPSVRCGFRRRPGPVARGSSRVPRAGSYPEGSCLCPLP